MSHSQKTGVFSACVTMAVLTGAYGRMAALICIGKNKLWFCSWHECSYTGKRVRKAQDVDTGHVCERGEGQKKVERVEGGRDKELKLKGNDER